MLKFEIKKLLLRKQIIIISVIPFCFLCWMMFLNLPTDINEKFDEFKDVNEYEIDSLKEKNNQLFLKLGSNDISNIEYKKIISETVILSSAIEELEYYYSYDAYMKNLITKETIKKTIYTDQFSIRKYNLFIGFYNRQRNIEIVNSKKWENVINLFFDSPAAVIFSIISVVWVVCVTVGGLYSEADFSCNEIVISTVNGKHKLLIKKIQAIVILEIIYNLMLLIFRILVILFVYKLYDFNVPIQSIITFKDCPFCINIFEFLLICSLLQFFTMLFVNGTVLIYEIIGKSFSFTILMSLLSLIVASYVVLANNLSDYSYNYLSLRNMIRTYIPLCGMNPTDYLINFDVHKFCGIPILRIFIIIFWDILLFVIATFINSVMIRNNKIKRTKGRINGKRIKNCKFSKKI